MTFWLKRPWNGPPVPIHGRAGSVEAMIAAGRRVEEDGRTLEVGWESTGQGAGGRLSEPRRWPEPDGLPSRVRHFTAVGTVPRRAGASRPASLRGLPAPGATPLPRAGRLRLLGTESSWRRPVTLSEPAMSPPGSTRPVPLRTGLARPRRSASGPSPSPLSEPDRPRLAAGGPSPSHLGESPRRSPIGGTPARALPRPLGPARGP